MCALVVVESMYGSTLCVAQAVAAALADSGHAVDLLEVGIAVTDERWHATAQRERELVVVGAPTHLGDLSTARTRMFARADGNPLSSGPGIREWLSVGGPPRGVPVAVFDTAVAGAGSAAATLAQHFPDRLVGAPMSFAVGGRTAGLLPGELERAGLWGLELAEALVARR